MKYQKLLAAGEAYEAISRPIPVYKERAFDNSGFSDGGKHNFSISGTSARTESKRRGRKALGGGGDLNVASAYIHAVHGVKWQSLLSGLSTEKANASAATSSSQSVTD